MGSSRLLSFLKDGMSSLVGPLSSTFAGRGGLEPLKKESDASCRAWSWIGSSAVSGSAGGVGGSGSVCCFVAIGDDSGGGSLTTAGCPSHFSSEDCGISKSLHGRVVRLLSEQRRSHVAAVCYRGFLGDGRDGSADVVAQAPNFNLRLEWSARVTAQALSLVEMGNGGSKPEQHVFNAYVVPMASIETYSD